MPIGNAATVLFFEEATQMGIPRATVLRMQTEGISLVDDLIDLDEVMMKNLVDNLRKPGGRIRDPDHEGDGPAAMIDTPPFIFGAKSHKRLMVAARAVRYQDTVGRSLTAALMQWDPVLKNFDQQWKALKARKDEAEADVPIISRALPIMRWTDSFRDYLHRTIGARMIPLVYVIRQDAVPVGEIPAAMNQQPYAAVYGSIAEELIARASHTHALFITDNQTVYYKLEEAVRETAYAASIKPFARAKNGRDAWFALVNQYAGNDKWDAELKRQVDNMYNKKWKGQSNYTLEKFVQMHRNAKAQMELCAEHIPFQVPNERTRVKYVLDNIESNDAPLLAAMSNVLTDEAKMTDFETAVSAILPHDPVVKRRDAVNKKHATRVAAADATSADISAFGSKVGIGPKTGVELRFHPHSEFVKLPREQREELSAWRRAEEAKGVVFPKSRGKGKGKGKGQQKHSPTQSPLKKKTKWTSAISAVEAQVAKLSASLAAKEEPPVEPADQDLKGALVAALREVASVEGAQQVSASSLNKILNRAVNGKGKKA